MADTKDQILKDFQVNCGDHYDIRYFLVQKKGCRIGFVRFLLYSALEATCDH